MTTASTRRPVPGVALAGGALFLATTAVVSSWTGPGNASALPAVLTAWLTAGPWALLWLAGAFGIGRSAARLLRSAGGWIVEAALGIALLLLLDMALGRLGLLSAFGGALAWALPVGGAIALLIDLRRRRDAPAATGATRPGPNRWLAALAAVPAAVLLVAATSAPGWLWATEFGGYDALSYHLQLPKEWLAHGRMTGLDHNVYSFLPGAMESAYLHLAILRGDAVRASITAQLLHATTALLAAGAVAATARRLGGTLGSAAAPVLLLGTPWLVVTGSLAYAEATVVFMLAAALLELAARDGRRTVARAPMSHEARRPAGDPESSATLGLGVIIGLLAGAATAAKLTSIGLVALPLALLLVLAVDRRGTRRAALAAAAAGALVLAPWLLGNAQQTGNPLFPFAPALGLGHWTAEQAAIWHAGHAPPPGVTARLVDLWNQFLRFGLGAATEPAEPWLPQWSLLPAAGAVLGAVAAALEPGRRRRIAVLAVVLIVQVAFWLLFTHARSRFLLPAAVPLVLLAALGVDAIAARITSRRLRPAFAAALAVALAAWALLPAVVLRTDRDGAPAALIGSVEARRGTGLGGAALADLAAALPEVHLNRALAPDARILAEGEAAPLYYDVDLDYHTVWDRGPVSRVVRAHPGAPQRWMSDLRTAGFTHLLLDVPMLERWRGAGWLDPRLDVDALRAAAERDAVLVAVFPSGTRLYELVDAMGD